MEFKRKTPNKRGYSSQRFASEATVVDSNVRQDLAIKYPFALQFFKYPPIQDSISLQEFEKFALDRLKVLRIIERTRLKHIRSTVQFREALYADLRKENLFGFYKKTPTDEENTKLIDYQDRRMDHISHFILRLAYCKTEELRRWFLRQEADLFAVRFAGESRENIKRWLAYNEMHFEMISAEEKERLHEHLISNRNCFISESTDFYKVPFTDVLELVSKRRVYIEKGYAYIKIKDLSVIVSSQFRAHLSQALTITARMLPSIEEDSRITPLLNNIHVRYVGQDYSASKGAGHSISRHELDGLSEKSFPLCMRQLHTALRHNHHLKHAGRLQYILFLKGIGMSLDEVLQFWRDEFTRIMDLDKFEKQYAYNVRHSFGKEGKRVSYTPYSCIKIIMTNNPSTGDHHGCPFRHTDAALLKQKLHAFKVSYRHVQEIMELVSQGHYQLACGRYFEATQGTEIKQGVTHPNQYFNESYAQSENSQEATKSAPFQSRLSQEHVAASSSASQSLPGHVASTSDSTSKLCQDEGDDDMDNIMASME